MTRIVLGAGTSSAGNWAVRATAELLGVEAIITRDASAYRDSSVPAMDARTYREYLG